MERTLQLAREVGPCLSLQGATELAESLVARTCRLPPRSMSLLGESLVPTATVVTGGYGRRDPASCSPCGLWKFSLPFADGCPKLGHLDFKAVIEDGQLSDRRGRLKVAEW